MGSIHSHAADRRCLPTENDIYTFGEMKNPEPIINAIQCDYNKFYIMKMPGDQEAINWRSVVWEVY